jgi:hypothetical protein
MGITNFDVVQANAFIGGILPISPFGNVWYVDGSNGADANTGKNPQTQAFLTIAQGISKAVAGDTIVIVPKTMAAGATDPASYAETVIIPAAKHSLTLLGVGNRTQGGLPQMKIGGSSTTPMLTIRAPGCRVMNIGFNGASSTGGGIKLDDDGSTKTAFGTEIANCHFKNLKGTGNASTEGAIFWSSAGGAWQVLIKDNLFYNCRAGIVLPGTSSSRPQDVVIERCVFQSSANTNIDADIYLAGGSGVDGLTIRDCHFSTVDVPAYASSPAAARYMDLTGCTDGMVSNCFFACIPNVSATEKTFGAAGTAAKVPTTVRMAGCWGEPSSDGTNEHGQIFRT